MRLRGMLLAKTNPFEICKRGAANDEPIKRARCSAPYTSQTFLYCEFSSALSQSFRTSMYWWRSNLQIEILADIQQSSSESITYL